MKREEKIKLEMQWLSSMCIRNSLDEDGFWFNKQHPNTLYIDNRIRDKGFRSHRPNWELKPDMVEDFRNLPFEDKSFYLVVMDPPQLFSKGETFDMVKAYGFLNRDTWKEDIKQGFDEAWRVLKPYGTLIFKWNESSVKVKELLSVLGRDPLFGHLTSRYTHWFAFMKIPRGA